MPAPLTPTTSWPGKAVGILAVVALAAAGLTLGSCGASPSAATVGQVTVYEPERRPPAPDLTGDLLDGGTFTLADHRGELVVLNFWASWCPPCRVEQNDLERVHQATRADGVTFVGINVKDQRDAARQAHAAGGVTYPSVFDPSSSLALTFDVPPTTIPATIVIDRDGRIAAIVRRAVVEADLTELIARVSRG
jgi:peroxiredoxin